MSPDRHGQQATRAPRAYATRTFEPQVASRARDLGFDSVVFLGAEASDPAGDAVARPAELAATAAAAKAAGLRSLVSLWLDTVCSQHSLAQTAAPQAFRPASSVSAGVVDPRAPFEALEGLSVLRRPQDAALLAWWDARLSALRAQGVDGFCVIDPGVAGRTLARRLREAGHDVVEVATGEPTRHTPGPVLIGALAPPTGPALDQRRRLLAHAAVRGAGWIVAAGFEDGLEAALRGINRLTTAAGAPALAMTGPGAALEVLVRPGLPSGLLLAHNRSGLARAWPPANLGIATEDLDPVDGFAPIGGLMAADHTLLFQVRTPGPVQASAPVTLEEAIDPALRVTIQNLTPSVESGAFAVKRVVGEALGVTVDIFADGHEKIAAELLFKADDADDWQRIPMLAAPNDVWTAQVRARQIGRHSLAVEAWLDVWGGFVRDFEAKRAVGLELSLERREGRALVQAAATRAPPAPDRLDLMGWLARFDVAGPRGQDDLLCSAELLAAMALADDRAFCARSFVQPVEIECTAAGFSSWYELFPRSQTDDKSRHGTFADVIARLPRVAAMGFDTLYFPPIHPIGVTNRKGPNNSLTPGREDVGSPYAIGSAEGGHDAIHPQLGTLEDFRALLAAAQAQGLEIALDFAIQCSPDHPWLKQHPDWFAWRPDGSMKYAENPPKKYQDIVNVDFYGPGAIPGLWQGLRDVVLFWAQEGVRTFRVDNPHTKPLPFWRWMIAEVRARYPDAIFLSEAFTRPKPMYQLARAGFSQSYTYFTWRHHKAEFEDYLSELTQTPVREFFRPHFFVNTPDIDPYFLQTSGRAGFLIRAALAATLSGLFGVYSGFELCESAPLPGREEYLDSEKYEIRVRPDRAPGDIVDEIAQLNALRRAEPALQTHLGVAFHKAFNDQILYYSKAVPGEAYLILVAVCLDPHNSQAADFEVPLWLLGLADHETVQVDDLLHARRFHWTGKVQHLRLTPDHPYAIWRIAPLKDA
jgi:starch synthase (maltosyl-transferring)